MSSVPEETVREIMVKSWNKCCVCKKEAHQIHHLDGDSTNHEIENLVYLCLEHHHQAEMEGGLGRSLTPDRLRSLRDAWYQTVEAQEQPLVIPETDVIDVALDTESLYQASLDAQIVMESRRVWRKIAEAERTDWNAHARSVRSLEDWIELASPRALKEILWILELAASSTRAGMPESSARAITLMVDQAIPSVELAKDAERGEVKATNVACFESAIRIGHQVAYDGAVKLGNPAVSECGAELLGRLLSYASEGLPESLTDSVQRQFESLFADTRITGSVFEEILRIHMENAEDEYWSKPTFPDHIVNQLY